MKVTGVRTSVYEYWMSRRMGDANSPSGRDLSSNCVVEITTDEGVTGIAIGGGGARPQIQSLVEGIITGEDPRQVTGLWQRMRDRAFKGGQSGIISDAISVIDVALWDIKAKYNEEPLWKTLGGSNPYVNAYASGMDMPTSNENLRGWYASMANDWGFKAGKLKVGIDQSQDIERIGLMKSGLEKSTKSPQLYIDANEYWSPKQAIRKVKEMEEIYDIAWIEEPCRRWDYLGLKRISDAVRAPVCAGENLDTLGEFLPYFDNRSADVIQVSWGMSGITSALQIADAAYAMELPITLGGSPGNMNAQLAPCMPNFLTLEVQVPEAEDNVIITDIKIKDGKALLGNAPGNGISIDFAALRKSIKSGTISYTAGPSPFGRRPGAGFWEYLQTDEEKAAAKAPLKSEVYVPPYGSKSDN